MNSNNSRPEGASGTEVLEPPEQPARVASGPADTPGGSQMPPAMPAYSLYPRYPGSEVPPQAQQLGYTPVPGTPSPGAGQVPPGYVQPQQQPVAGQGVSPLAMVLFILGSIVLLGLAFAIAAALMVSNIIGQVTNPAVGELQTETQSIALGEARSVVADVSIGVGKLNISGGATDSSSESALTLMNATFIYNIAAWKPTVSYNVFGDNKEGTLLVQQPNQGSLNMGPNVRYDWDLRFNNNVPMTMKVDIGVGQGNLKFGGLDLSRLEVNSGVGDTTVDLTGQWLQDLEVLVNGGVGQVTIILPSDTGVRVTAEGGLGQVNANGLTVNGNTYTNSAYGTAPTTLNIDVKTGIGDIQLVQGK